MVIHKDDQAPMNDDFVRVMHKVSTLGQDTSKLVDCSEVIPIPKSLPRFQASAVLPFGKTEDDIERSVCASAILMTMNMGVLDLICLFAYRSAQVTGLCPTDYRLLWCWRSTLLGRGLNSASCYWITLWFTGQHFYVSSLDSSLNSTTTVGH